MTPFSCCIVLLFLTVPTGSRATCEEELTARVTRGRVAIFVTSSPPLRNHGKSNVIEARVGKDDPFVEAFPGDKNSARVFKNLHQRVGYPDVVATVYRYQKYGDIMSEVFIDDVGEFAPNGPSYSEINLKINELKIVGHSGSAPILNVIEVGGHLVVPGDAQTAHLLQILAAKSPNTRHTFSVWSYRYVSRGHLIVRIYASPSALKNIKKKLPYEDYNIVATPVPPLRNQGNEKLIESYLFDEGILIEARPGDLASAVMITANANTNQFYEAVKGFPYRFIDAAQEVSAILFD